MFLNKSGQIRSFAAALLVIRKKFRTGFVNLQSRRRFNNGPTGQQQMTKHDAGSHASVKFVAVGGFR
jgi:hypothetical protein